ncbi:4a-hydroxytetrahydrobiopterin dehydratase [Patescibacteria group bacterium]|jgi:4a-hydroxytetrahydrobiopterin dehydratase|nr:4a-hydroxytetrahydrobiopterin dehydratase [Patescibacteria group bacterium]
MNFDLRGWQNMKETLLVFTVLYFYALAFALIFGRNTYGLDHPVAFLFMSGCFLVAIGIELAAAWWSRRRFVVWMVLGVLTYAGVGFIVAPRLFGEWIISYVLLEPLVVVLIGGIAFTIATIISRTFFGSTKLSAGQIADALRELPGWNLERGALVKQFSFSDFVHALNFVNLLSENLQRFATHLSFDLSFGKVRVALSSPNGSGIGSRDIELAKLIEKL